MNRIVKDKNLKAAPVLRREVKNLLKKFRELRILVMKEENTWMWSIFAIFALLFTAFILLYFIFFSAEL